MYKEKQNSSKINYTKLVISIYLNRKFIKISVLTLNIIQFDVRFNLTKYYLVLWFKKKREEL